MCGSTNETIAATRPSASEQELSSSDDSSDASSNSSSTSSSSASDTASQPVLPIKLSSCVSSSSLVEGMSSKILIGAFRRDPRQSEFRSNPQEEHLSRSNQWRWRRRHRADAPIPLPSCKQANETGFWVYALFFVFLVAFAQDVHNIYAAEESSVLPPHQCIYIPGGGFSGFWFTLGRLQSIPKEERLDHDYYCYSAGCLAVVASTILDKEMEDMYQMAHSVQRQWRDGTLGRYSVVRTFLDDLLYGTSRNSSGIALVDSESPLLDLSGLSKIHIITTTRHQGFFVKTHIRTARTLEELHEMLLQTTWIPFAVGESLWLNGHMDGAFTALYHPTCHRQLGLAGNFWLLANVINVNLSRRGVEMFWKLGLEYGFHG